LDPSVEPGSNPHVRPEEQPGSLLALALLALIAGGAAGLICAAFGILVGWVSESETHHLRPLRWVSRTLNPSYNSSLVKHVIVSEL
jgi:hypothetical protein